MNGHLYSVLSRRPSRRKFAWRVLRHTLCIVSPTIVTAILNWWIVIAVYLCIGGGQVFLFTARFIIVCTGCSFQKWIKSNFREKRAMEVIILFKLLYFPWFHSLKRSLNVHIACSLYSIAHNTILVRNNIWTHRGVLCRLSVPDFAQEMCIYF